MMDEPLSGKVNDAKPEGPPRIVIEFDPAGQPTVALSRTTPSHLAVAAKWLDTLAEFQIGQLITHQAQPPEPRVLPVRVGPR
jgi:hypothetical protein